ncbi:MAG: methyl-accepting chemotaxis protein [Treponema sp.]|nr:methyl-accepting chemotaxis protein [Treponema sp.]
MKIKIKLSIMMIAIVVIIAGGIAVIELQRASGIALNLAKQKIMYLVNMRTQYWEGRLNGYLDILKTISNVMNYYENIAPELRRDQYEAVMRSVFENEPDFVRMFTVWKPNAIDGADSRYIGRTGSTETGQFAFSLTRETGQITAITSIVVSEAMEHITGPNAHKASASDPTPIKLAGKDAFIVKIMAPIINKRTNEAVGVIGCQLNIDLIQPTIANDIKTYEEISGMSIYSGNGFILGNIVPERIGKTLTEAETVYGDYLKAANQSVLEGKPFSCSSYSPLLETNVEIEIAPFKIGDSDETWSIMIASSESYILKEVNEMKKFVIILAAIALAIAVVIIYFVLNNTTRPIVRVAETLKDISEGEGDLTRSIAVSSKDEIGDLALYFNKTLEKIKNLIVIIKGETAGLQNIGNDLASNMTETAAAINQITANIQSIKGRVISQSASVTETNATMEQVITNINKLNDHVENQSGNISQSSSAIEQMVANINSVTNSLINNSANVTNLTEASEAGRAGLQEVSVDIQEIARESEGLLEINSVMENIASQTNLLSMNAAIEAAHAGEAGKGFAVVADEIRKLAESSGEQSKTIGTVLKKIKESIDKIARSTGKVLTGFQAIDSGVKTVAEQEENIRNAMEEQSEGSKQLLQSTSGLNEITQQVKNGSEEMLEGSKEVMKESQNLERVTQEITGSMNEMSSGADQVNIAVNHVNEISGRNREGIETLMREVSRFKVA